MPPRMVYTLMQLVHRLPDLPFLVCVVLYKTSKILPFHECKVRH